MLKLKPASSKGTNICSTRNNEETNGTSFNQKKNNFKRDKKLIYLTDYMKKIIKQRNPQGTYYCDICPLKPKLLKKNIYRHILSNLKHQNSIIKKEDIEAHNRLIKAIQDKQEENRKMCPKYKSNFEQEQSGKKEYLQFLGFCQRQNFSFKQISALGRYLKKLCCEKRFSFFSKYSFERNEISLISRCYGKCILEKLKKDLSNSPYSFTIDSSTVAKKNICALKVRYLKETVDAEGVKRNKLQNRIIGIKYLKESSDAKTMFHFVQEKLLNLNPQIESNMVGYVHDHASNLSGLHNGLGALLKDKFDKKNHFFMDIKDPCHALNLVLTHSLESLPTNIMDFVEKIHNFFISPQRIAFLTRLQIENNFIVLSPKHYAKTRWLSLGESLQRLLLIWESLEKLMELKPSFSGVQKEKFKEFSKLLEDKNFKLQIIFLAGVVDKINKVNIKLQGQTLEIHHLKPTLHSLIKSISKLLLKPKHIPADLMKFKGESDEEFNFEKDKFLECEDFIENAIRDVDIRLSSLNSSPNTEKENFTNIFQPFLVKALKLLIKYIPLKDEIINTLDFVTLTAEDFKKKVFTFNEKFQIIPFEKTNELSEEIAKLEEENYVYLKRIAKDSSLMLWDIIQENSDLDIYENCSYQHLSKIMKVAHVLPTSSAGVEQTFSSLKLIRSSIRNRLKEDTVQSLLMISEEFKDEHFEIDEEMMNSLEQTKKNFKMSKEMDKKDFKEENMTFPPVIEGKSSQNEKSSKFSKIKINN